MTEAVRTLCETVSDLSTLFMTQPELPADSRELCRLVIEWAEAFERQYAGETWIDREYLEVIETFFYEHYLGWLEGAPPSAVRIVR